MIAAVHLEVLSFHHVGLEIQRKCKLRSGDKLLYPLGQHAGHSCVCRGGDCLYFYYFDLLLRQGLFVAKYGLEFMLLLPKPPKCWDYRLATISGFRNAGD